MRWLPVNRAAVLLTLTAILHLSSHSGRKSNTRCHQRTTLALHRPARPRDDSAVSVCRQCIAHIVQEIGSCPALLLLISGVGRIARRRRQRRSCVVGENWRRLF
ncbi:hypothetical protein EVAR_57631_1 [Eumeta japonica]|uniref:Secreted protein n=1 Tax=Eumeta variegata TaxID=151549 RepID=A0A4C1ZQI3_EUMVA|nr:hypothetical protein EVAR_57631_1 [Eumeta japonica]